MLLLVRLGAVYWTWTDDDKLVGLELWVPTAMPEGLWPVLAFIAIVIIYVIAKVIENVKKSEQQWLQVDKSKLREWDDDDDWDD